MKSMKLKSIFLSVLCATTVAHGGEKAGNGGGAHYCANPKQDQKMIELYDLYEGRDRHGYTFAQLDPSLSKEDYINRAIEKVRALKPGVADSLVGLLKEYNQKVKDKGKKQLSLVPDAFSLYVDEGCEYRQMVNWIDKSQADFYGLSEAAIYRDETKYLMMDTMNRAALDFHEVLYKYVRVKMQLFRNIHQAKAPSFYSYASHEVRMQMDLQDQKNEKNMDIIDDAIQSSAWVRRLVANVFSEQSVDNDLFISVIQESGLGFLDGKSFSAYKETSFKQGSYDMELQIVSDDINCDSSSIQVTLTNVSGNRPISYDYNNRKVLLNVGSSVVLKWFRREESKRNAREDIIFSGAWLTETLFGSAKNYAVVRWNVKGCGIDQTFEETLEDGHRYKGITLHKMSVSSQ